MPSGTPRHRSTCEQCGVPVRATYGGKPVRYCRTCGPRITQAYRDQRRRDRRMRMVYELDPEDASRLEKATVGGLKLAEGHGHDMTTPEPDGAPAIVGTQVSHCRKCGDVMAVDVMEQYGPIGNAILRDCGTVSVAPAVRRSEFDEHSAVATRLQEPVERDAMIDSGRRAQWAWGLDADEWNDVSTRYR